MTIFHYLLAFLAALSAGIINALAGGGTLVTFPTLLALGLPPISANVTNTMGLCPGFLGGTLAQVNDLRGQKRRAWIVIPAAVLGGLTGAILLLQTTEKLFSALVPFMILLASVLLALQEPLRNWLNHRQGRQIQGPILAVWLFLPVFLGSIYGGYFGAGLSVILLAVLGLILNDNLTRLNALKQTIALSTNITAAMFFIFSGKVFWVVAVVMMAGALAGGSLGGRLAGRVKPVTLRWIVVTIGLIVGMIYLVKTFLIA
jgi:uncharacterized membrane protein YfcA